MKNTSSRIKPVVKPVRVGAIMIKTGFWGTSILYYKYNKEPQNSVGKCLGPCSMPRVHHLLFGLLTQTRLGAGGIRPRLERDLGFWALGC